MQTNIVSHLTVPADVVLHLAVDLLQCHRVNVQVSLLGLQAVVLLLVRAFVECTVALLAQEGGGALENRLVTIAMDQLDLILLHGVVHCAAHLRIVHGAVNQSFVLAQKLVLSKQKLSDFVLDTLKHAADLALGDLGPVLEVGLLAVVAFLLCNLVLSNVLVHDLVVELSRVLVSEIVVKLSALWLDHVGLGWGARVVEAVLLGRPHVLAQQFLVLPGGVLLVH